MDEKLKMPPPGERRILTGPNAVHPALGPSSARVRAMPGPIQPDADAKPITCAITYIPAPGLEDDAPAGIYWATNNGVVLSPAVQEPIRLEHMKEGEGKVEGEENGERPEDAHQEAEGSEPS